MISKSFKDLFDTAIWYSPIIEERMKTVVRAEVRVVAGLAKRLQSQRRTSCNLQTHHNCPRRSCQHATRSE